MNFKLLPVSQEDLANYKKDMQEAFQKGAAAEFSDLDAEILPEEDIDRSLNTKGSIAFKVSIRARPGQCGSHRQDDSRGEPSGQSAHG